MQAHRGNGPVAPNGSALVESLVLDRVLAMVLLLENDFAIVGVEDSMDFKLANLVLTLACDFVIVELELLELHLVVASVLGVVPMPVTFVAWSLHMVMVVLLMGRELLARERLRREALAWIRLLGEARLRLISRHGLTWEAWLRLITRHRLAGETWHRLLAWIARHWLAWESRLWHGITGLRHGVSRGRHHWCLRHSWVCGCEDCLEEQLSYRGPFILKPEVISDAIVIA